MSIMSIGGGGGGSQCGLVVKYLTRNLGVLSSSHTGSSGCFHGIVLGQDTSEPLPSSISVKSRRQLTLFMSFLGFTCRIVLNGVLRRFQQYFSHITATAHIVHVFPGFHQYYAGL